MPLFEGGDGALAPRGERAAGIAEAVMSSKKQQQQQVGSSGGRRDRRNAKGLLDSAGGAIAVAVSTALSGMLAQSAEAKGGIKVEKVARGTAQFTTRGSNTQIRVSDRAIIN